MNNFSKLSLYDFLAMLIPGFVILWFFNFFGIDSSNVVNDFLIAVLCYVTGLFYHKVIEYISHKLHLIRNVCLETRAWEKFHDKINESKDVPEKIDDFYVAAYYKLAKNGCLMNIPVLEAQEAFLRNMIPLLLFLIPYVGCNCSNFEYECCFPLFLTLLFVASIIIWVCISLKIYFLVWEGNHYLNLLNDEKTTY